jgi:para-aminobenzoate synthetase component 1
VIVRAVSSPASAVAAVGAAAARHLPCALQVAPAGGEARLLVACDPVRVERGASVEALAAAWIEERARWAAADAPGIPVGVGYLSYDLGRVFERIRGREPPVSAWPLVEFRFYDAFLALASGAAGAEIWARSEAAAKRLAAALQPSGPAEEAARSPAGQALEELEPPAAHLAAVACALEYIRAGDIYQVNLARRLGCTVGGQLGVAPGARLWLRLAHDAPAPHAFWMGDGEAGTAIVGNSPERFLRRWVDGTVEACPIKGTRPRDQAADAGGAERLLASAKDRAEHVMIVDLERNDLGRVCRTGSVEVADLCRVLALPTVLHLESTIRGRLRPEVGLAELLRATFPGGSVTGAPKLRATEIIEELEPARRGPYTGATGWLGAAGDLDLAVAIRTAVIRGGRLTLWVGGGVVADSTPAGELAETWDKARAFSRALG